VDGLHDDGKKIFTYPCDMAADIQRARGLKVDGIMTNDPGGAPWREIF